MIKAFIETYVGTVRNLVSDVPCGAQDFHPHQIFNVKIHLFGNGLTVAGSTNVQCC